MFFLAEVRTAPVLSSAAYFTKLGDSVWYLNDIFIQKEDYILGYIHFALRDLVTNSFNTFKARNVRDIKVLHNVWSLEAK